LPSQVLRDVVTFAYWTGMRKGEILSLNWDGYDHATKTITLQAARRRPATAGSSDAARTRSWWRSSSVGLPSAASTRP
jgi:integrase